MSMCDYDRLPGDYVPGECFFHLTWAHKKAEFNAQEWADRKCEWRDNTHFHAHPTLPCGKECLSDLWSFMAEEYGTPIYCNKPSDPDKIDQWIVTQRRLIKKQEEYERRIALIIDLMHRTNA